ncbi:MAG: AraC family transcriptional regulator [Steroidobacteraceae bacterium]|nr:helix-turn-helix transcriptional regulator [Nevskiaceae bacterium]MCP5359795.1 helix-turn-helix transcriptional regulator [Nevskiaceae bacterium]MCP5467408.1 helix-turn-helix transcriptional regulator [Nevskiaceae bacterium]MCP5472715.1 helix-turn-helix transcriptional regulator [Nevskiaceae bacterium]
MNMLFDTTGKSSVEALRCWSEMTRREFYSGDLESTGAEPPNFRFTKSVGYPVSLTRLVCDAPIGYRRSWEHIRRDAAALRVLWFVRRGGLRFVRCQDRFDVVPGTCGIVDCNVPFNGQISCDAGGVFESIQAVVPANLFLECIPNGARCGGAFTLLGAAGQIVESTLDLLWNHGDSINEITRTALLRAMLCALQGCIGEHPTTQRAPSVVEQRITEVEQYILMHHSDPGLSADKVAAGCGISPRYLAHLMRERDNTFSDFLWKHRLSQARDNLVAAGLRDRTIAEVAFTSGFKSAAHFCRMFKIVYGCTPSEYRLANRRCAASSASPESELQPESFAQPVSTSMSDLAWGEM